MSTPPFLDLPEGVKRVFVPISRARLRGLRTEGSGASALLVPGFTGSKEDFIAVLRPLLERGWSALAIDQLGQFESSGPDDETAYSLLSLSRDVVDVATGLPGPVNLVGHSLGGLVCAEAVLARPDLFASLILLDSGPGPLPPERHGLLRSLRAAIPHASMEQIWQVKQAQDRALGILAPPPHVDAFLHHRWLKTNPRALSAKAELLMTAPDPTPRLRDIAATESVRLLVAFGVGDRDAWTPAQQRAMAAELAVPSVEIPDAGHSPAAENPEATAAVFDRFWRPVGFRPLPGSTNEHSAFPGGRGTTGREPTSGDGSHNPTSRSVKPPSGGYPASVEFHLPLNRAPEAARLARRATSARLSEWGLAVCADDALLVVSELVTNAVRHGREPIVLHLSTRGELVLIAVQDGLTTRLPAPRGLTHTQPSGRGMHLVSAVSQRWGWDRGQNYKVVWAEIPLAS